MQEEMFEQFVDSSEIDFSVNSRLEARFPVNGDEFRAPSVVHVQKKRLNFTTDDSESDQDNSNNTVLTTRVSPINLSDDEDRLLPNEDFDEGCHVLEVVDKNLNEMFEEHEGSDRLQDSRDEIGFCSSSSKCDTVDDEDVISRRPKPTFKLDKHSLKSSSELPKQVNMKQLKRRQRTSESVNTFSMTSQDISLKRRNIDVGVFKSPSSPISKTSLSHRSGKIGGVGDDLFTSMMRTRLFNNQQDSPPSSLNKSKLTVHSSPVISPSAMNDNHGQFSPLFSPASSTSIPVSMSSCSVSSSTNKSTMSTATTPSPTIKGDIGDLIHHDKMHSPPVAGVLNMKLFDSSDSNQVKTGLVKPKFREHPRRTSMMPVKSVSIATPVVNRSMESCFTRQTLALDCSSVSSSRFTSIRRPFSTDAQIQKSGMKSQQSVMFTPSSTSDTSTVSVNNNSGASGSNVSTNINPFTPSPTPIDLMLGNQSMVSADSFTISTPSHARPSLNDSTSTSSHIDDVKSNDESTLESLTTNRQLDFNDDEDEQNLSLNTSESKIKMESTHSIINRRTSQSSAVSRPTSKAQKRLRVRDLNINRYEQEFVELFEAGNGEFGHVTIARHRLDGMVYAIKSTQNTLIGNNHEERIAMNEVFAHAALMKHKHVVRYYNSWVENGRIFIQNEFCAGGSLSRLVEEKRLAYARCQETMMTNSNTNDENEIAPNGCASKHFFSENDLRKILAHVAKGLHYMHSRRLVHLDIKPENIFIAHDITSNSPGTSPPTKYSNNHLMNGEEQDLEEEELPSVVQNGAGIRRSSGGGGGNDSTDSGHASGNDFKCSIQQNTHQSSVNTCNSVSSSSSCSCFCCLNPEQCFSQPQNVSPSSVNSGSPSRNISYKIGDLGHVVPIDSSTSSSSTSTNGPSSSSSCYSNTEFMAEEGDCRYMAPELLASVIDRQQLPKADIFSLGLTMYECASLDVMPKNSMECDLYEKLKCGELPYLHRYSPQFNALLKAMVNPDVLSRPSSSRLVNHPYLLKASSPKGRNLIAATANHNLLMSGSGSNTKAELYRELRATRRKLYKLQQQLAQVDANNSNGNQMPASASCRPNKVRSRVLLADEFNSELESTTANVIVGSSLSTPKASSFSYQSNQTMSTFTSSSAKRMRKSVNNNNGGGGGECLDFFSSSSCDGECL